MVDASGLTDKEGVQVVDGEGDPADDIGWVRMEIHRYATYYFLFFLVIHACGGVVAAVVKLTAFPAIWYSPLPRCTMKASLFALS